MLLYISKQSYKNYSSFNIKNIKDKLYFSCLNLSYNQHIFAKYLFVAILGYELTESYYEYTFYTDFSISF